MLLGWSTDHVEFRRCLAFSRAQADAMSAEALQPKAIYEPVTKLEAFYTGGSVRVTRDHKHIACACGDEVKILDVATGVVSRTLPGDSEPITSLAVSPNCKTLVAASRSLQVKQWDWTSGECKRTWKPHRAPVADLAIDASGGYVASGSADRSIKITDLAGGYVTHHFTGHGGIVLRVLFHPKQLLLFSSCDAGEVRIWDLVTKSCAYSLQNGHMSAVPALALSPDGWHLLSGGRDKVVCVWDIRNGSRVATVPVFEALEGIAVLPAGSAFPGAAAAAQHSSSSKPAHKALCFATAGEKGQIRIWRSDTGTCVYTHHSSSSSSSLLQRASSKSKRAIAAAADGAAAAGDEFVELMLLPRGKGLMAATGDARLLFYHPTADPEPGLTLTRQLIGNHDEITDLAFLYSGSSSSSDQQNLGQSHDQHPSADLTTEQTTVINGGLALQPGEPRRLAVATNSHDIRLFDLSDASCVGACVGHRDIVLCLDTVRPAPGVELLASGSKDCEVRVWDPATATCLAAAAGHVAAITAVAWSKSKAKGGKYLASGGADKLLKLWDTSKVLTAAAAAAESGEAPQMQQLTTVAAVAAHEKDVNALAFSPNDALLATASQDKTVKLWKLPNLVLVQTLRGHKRGVWDVAFSPVDQVVITCSGDKLLKLWSVSEGTCLRTFEGHTAGVLRASFITAGTQILSAGADGLLKLWDARTGINSNTFEGHEDRLWGLTTSDPATAESLVASGGGDSRVVIWRDVTAVKAAEAEAAEESLVIKQQELSNALADGDYATAARLAFQLRHPGRLLEVLRRQQGGAAAAVAALQKLVGQLTQEELATALSYCREWNTNTRNAHLAQVLLQAVLKTHSPQQILAVQGARDLIDGLLAYSQRHAARIDRLMRATFLLDYTLAASQVLLPEETVRDLPLQQQQEEDLPQQQQAAAVEKGGDDLSDDFGDLNGVLKMNGHADADSSDSDLGDQSDQQQQSGSGSEDQHDQGSGDQTSGDEDDDLDMQPGSSGQSPAAAAAAKKRSTAAAGVEDPMDQQDDAYVDDGVQLPGWGGGDDLDDDWVAGSAEEHDSQDNTSDSDNDNVRDSDGGDHGDSESGLLGANGGTGSGDQLLGASSSDEEMQDGSGSSSREGEEGTSSDDDAAAVQAAVRGARSKQQQQRQRPGGQQHQQQQGTPGAAGKRGVAAAQAVAAAGKSPKRRRMQHRRA